MFTKISDYEMIKVTKKNRKEGILLSIINGEYFGAVEREADYHALANVRQFTQAVFFTKEYKEFMEWHNQRGYMYCEVESEEELKKWLKENKDDLECDYDIDFRKRTIIDRELIGIMLENVEYCGNDFLHGNLDQGKTLKKKVDEIERYYHELENRGKQIERIENARKTERSEKLTDENGNTIGLGDLFG